MPCIPVPNLVGIRLWEKFVTGGSMLPSWAQNGSHQSCAASCYFQQWIVFHNIRCTHHAPTTSHLILHKAAESESKCTLDCLKSMPWDISSVDWSLVDKSKQHVWPRVAFPDHAMHPRPKFGWELGCGRNLWPGGLCCHLERKMAATNRVLLHVTFNNELFFTTSAAHITPQPPPI